MIINYFLVSDTIIENILRENSIPFSYLNIFDTKGIVVDKLGACYLKIILERSYNKTINLNKFFSTGYDGIYHVCVSPCYKNDNYDDYNDYNEKDLQEELEDIETEDMDDMNMELEELRERRESIRVKLNCIPSCNDVCVSENDTSESEDFDDFLDNKIML